MYKRQDFDCKIDVVTCGLNQKVISSFNVPVLVDKVMDEVSADGYDAVSYTHLPIFFNLPSSRRRRICRMAVLLAIPQRYCPRRQTHWLKML